ncbi:MAG: DNA polymerase IV [Desulfovibrionaceae bacterium]|nr:DNA polymerase IV [Desulfovibrionaceae bacterium]
MRTIFHVDVNSAFLSWSAVKLLPQKQIDLRLVPAVVCGSTDSRHGIVLAKSQPAKACGVQTGEPLGLAFRKCPKLVLVRADFKVYKEYSQQFISILHSYCDKVEKASIDEAYLDMTSRLEILSEIANCATIDPINIAFDIKNSIKNRLGFTVNIGISTNKLLAKMASDFEKPDKVHTLYPNEIDRKMWILPVNDLYGCGNKTSAKLRQLGIETIGQIAKTSLSRLQNILGKKLGEYIYYSAHGINDSQVNPIPDARKSYSCEMTTELDININNYAIYIPKILHELVDELTRRIKRDHIFGRTLFIVITTADFKRHTRQKSIAATNDPIELYNIARLFLDDFLLGNNKQGVLYNVKGIRLFGIGVTNLTNFCLRQKSLLDYID